LNILKSGIYFLYENLKEQFEIGLENSAVKIDVNSSTENLSEEDS
jgi:hypothetical protein